MSLLDHRELAIIKGVGPTPGDTASAEQPLAVVDLMTAGSAFALVEWTPNIPSLKSGGVWADSNITDGRTLLSGVNTNVIETIKVQLTGSTIADFASQFAKFQRMIQDARDFWNTVRQIEPVYLRWWANQAPGPQFALIYSIDMDVEWGDSNLAQATLTLAIEREFGWRAVRPGGNPKEWFLGNQLNAINATNISITAGAGIVNATVSNRNEFATTNRQTIVTKNYIDITAAQVPGDLPALTLIYAVCANASPAGNWQFFASRKSVPSGQLDGASNAFTQSLMFNAGDMTLGANTALAADTGAPLTQSGGVRRRAEYTPVGGTDGVRLAVTARNMANHRGRYAVFVRARQAAGAQGDMAMHLVYGQYGGSPVILRVANPSIAPVLQAGVGNTTNWPVSYLGTISLPLAANMTSGIPGKGIGYSATGDVALELWVQRVAGATATLYVADFVLIPIDEPTIEIIAPTNAISWAAFLDGTSYFTHGKPDYFAVGDGNSTDSTSAAEARGQAITLLPKTAQRLYFFAMSTTNLSNIVTDTISVSLDIVPRWSGIRDQ